MGTVSSNVRELRNVIERAVILVRGGSLEFDLPIQTASSPSPVSKSRAETEAAGADEPGFLTEAEVSCLDGLNRFRSFVETHCSLSDSAGLVRLWLMSENIRKAERALEIADARYKAGAGTQIDVLDAQTARTDARGSYVNALRDYSVARAGLIRATGTDILPGIKPSQPQSQQRQPHEARTNREKSNARQPRKVLAIHEFQ